MQFHAEHPVKSRRIHDAALHRVGGINPWGAHVNLGFGVTRSWHYGKIGLRLDLPSGFRLEGLAQIHAHGKLPNVLEIAIGTEQVAALIELRGERIRLHCHVTDADMGHHVEDVGLDHVLGLNPGGNHVGIHIRFDLSAHAEGGRDVLLQLLSVIS